MIAGIFDVVKCAAGEGCLVHGTRTYLGLRVDVGPLTDQHIRAGRLV